MNEQRITNAVAFADRRHLDIALIGHEGRWWTIENEKVDKAWKALYEVYIYENYQDLWILTDAELLERHGDWFK